MKRSGLLLFSYAFLLTSCVHDSLYVPIEDENVTIDENCDPNKVYFVNEILPIIGSNCAISGCHGGGSTQNGVELSTYSGILEIVRPGDAIDSDIYEVITDIDPDKMMPPPPNTPLSSQQISLIIEWINQGATNEECSDCDLTNVTFAQSVWPIIQNSCTGCHSGATPQGNLSLTNYDEISQIAQSGALLGVIKHEIGYVPMPFNGQQLSVCKIDTVEDWINQGFPDN